MVDDAAAKTIYRQIAAIPELRPFDFLLTNFPGLDDTHWAWGSREIHCGSAMGFGDWVNGGVWGSAEGRAILRLSPRQVRGRPPFAARAMKWAKDFRMDAPWSQRGENTHNFWSDGGGYQVGGVAVMVDDFAIPAATVRGLFDYEYRSDRLILRPHVPGSITEYVQKHPVRFGKKTIYLSCRNGGPKIKSVVVNGKSCKTESPETVALVYDELPEEARVEIVTEGGWETQPARTASARNGPTNPESNDALRRTSRRVEEALRRADGDGRALGAGARRGRRAGVCARVVGSDRSLPNASRDRPQPRVLRPMTPAKRAAIFKFYANTALRMYDSLARRMTRYAESADVAKKRLNELFQQAQQ